MAKLNLFWIETPGMRGRIAVMPRPHPDQFAALKAAGVDCIVSLMQPAEAQRFGLGDEAGLCAAAGIAFSALPVVDHGIPESVAPVEAASAKIRGRLARGEGVAVHCFAGLGRSPLLIAAALIDLGFGAEEACEAISRARGFNVPEMEEQYQWLLAYARRHDGGVR